MDKLNQKPILNGSFPHNSNDLKISDDRNNPAHKPHFDVVQSIPGGVDKARVTPKGKILSGTTHIGKGKADW